MTGGDIVLTPLPQADGQVKNRPTLVLCRVRPFNDLMVCGISSQLRLLVPDFDEIISPGDEDFDVSGLRGQSLIRLGYVSTVPVAGVKGRVGGINALRYRRNDQPARGLLVPSRENVIDPLVRAGGAFSE